jgi:hypothetical protein
MPEHVFQAGIQGFEIEVTVGIDKQCHAAEALI